MYITGWTVLLSALGAIPALWVQERAFAWVWVLGVMVVALLDAALAPNPTSVGVRRETPRAVRLTESTSVRLAVTNLGSRRLVGAVRDAWQPSAGAGDNRHRLSLRPGDTTTLVTTALPTRRGDRMADAV